MSSALVYAICGSIQRYLGMETQGRVIIHHADEIFRGVFHGAGVILCLILKSLHAGNSRNNANKGHWVQIIPSKYLNQKIFCSVVKASGAYMATRLTDMDVTLLHARLTQHLAHRLQQ